MKLRTLFLVAMWGALPAMAHDHYAAGIVDTNGNQQADAGERLQFVGASPVGKIFHLCPRPFGFRPTQRCGGYYMLDEFPRTLHPNDSFSFTALSDGQFEDIIEPTYHAHTGAYIWMEIVSVTGPRDGEFGFWDEGQSANFDSPTVSFPVGQPTGNYAFVLSEGSDFPGEDPLGHIHGRAWTATVAGDYYVSFRLVDRSTSNFGGPWHQPSQVYTLQFQAGPEMRPTYSFTAGGNFRFTWPSLMGIYNATGQPGIAFQIERASSLSPPNWQVIGTVNGTTAATATFTEPSVPAGKRYYRFKYTWNPGSLGGLAAAESAALTSSQAASESVAAAMTAAALTPAAKTGKSSSAATALALRNAAIVWQAGNAALLAQLQSFFAKAKAAQARPNTARPKRAKTPLNFKSLTPLPPKPKPKTHK